MNERTLSFRARAAIPARLDILTMCLAIAIALAARADPLLAGQPPAGAVDSGEEKIVQKIETLAFFPLMNLTDDFDAPHVITPLIQEELDKKQFRIIPRSELDSFLFGRRIRDTSAVNSVTAFELNRALGADAVLIGTIDSYATVAQEAYAGVTLRLVGTRTSAIVWMESLSYAGNDFKGMFGLGQVTSPEELSRIIIPRVFKSIPKEYVFERRHIKPFVLGDARVEPSVTGGGKELYLSVKIIPLTETPTSVQARVGGVAYQLTNGSGEYYNGKIMSPPEGGLYPVDIIVARPEGDHCYSSVALVTVDMMPPNVSIATTKDTIGPWKRNRKDYTLFTVTADEVTYKWKVDILDENDKYVRGGKGFGVIPRQLIWRGESDSGARNKDGIYTFRLFAWDAAGNMGIFEKKIRLDATAPVVNIRTEINEEGTGLIVHFEYDKQEAIKNWEFSLFDGESVLIKKMSGEGNIQNKITVPWPDRAGKSGGIEIKYTISAEDIAGNIYEASGQEFFTAQRSPKPGLKFTKGMFGNKWGLAEF